jgi:hypothetical protein
MLETAHRDGVLESVVIEQGLFAGSVAADARPDVFEYVGSVTAGEKGAFIDLRLVDHLEVATIRAQVAPGGGNTGLVEVRYRTGTVMTTGW